AAAAAPLLRQVDVQRAAVELRAVHLLHRLLGGARVGKRHEAEAAAAARVTVGDDLGVRDLAETRERFLEAAIVRVPAETADEKLVGHVLSLSSVLTANGRPRVSS